MKKVDKRFLKVLFWVLFVLTAFICTLIFFPIVSIVISAIGTTLILTFCIYDLIYDES